MGSRYMCGDDVGGGIGILEVLLVLERKTRGRQLHLAKCFGPKRAFFSCKKGYTTNYAR